MNPEILFHSGLSQSTKRNITSLHLSKSAGKRLFIGIDVGSTSSDIVVMDSENRMLFADYKRTIGRPLYVLCEQMVGLFDAIDATMIARTAITGSVGRLIASEMGLPFCNEVSAQAAAIAMLHPEAATIIDMGGQDSKLIFLYKEGDDITIKDFALNTVCAAGTGAFLDQQAKRLGVSIEDEFSRLALQSQCPPRIAGRCSVFAKSDMIHLQQQATPLHDIIAGLCLGLAANLKSNLGCGREFIRPIVFTGGVAANIGVVKAIEKVLNLTPGELIVPADHFFTGAIGAVLLAGKSSNHQSACRIDILKLQKFAEAHHKTGSTSSIHLPLPHPKLPPPQSLVHEELLAASNEKINAYLGVDVGSISTNVAVIDENYQLLAKAYLMTAGKPLDAIKQGICMVVPKIAEKVNIIGAGTTGSGRYLTGDFIGADIVINEITAQATGAGIVNPKVDTIFEIGGQDSKYIALKNGVVVDFEMNHACAAGTGSFLEEQAQRLGIKIEKEFARLAFQSTAPIKLGERCTVFMESDLLNHQQQGAETKDLVAGLSYAIAANYLNRVVGRRKIGDNICFQGGTAFNKAVWAAFEQITGKPIMVPDHHEVTGAIGAAAVAAIYMKDLAAQSGTPVGSKFKGFDNIAFAKFSAESFICEHCSNHCEIKKISLAGRESLYYGSRCDRYNMTEKKRKTTKYNAFEFRNEALFKYAGLEKNRAKDKVLGPTVAIPFALANLQYLPLFATFLRELGCNVITSGRTDKEIIRIGVESVSAPTCFPVKVAYGHIKKLLAEKPDYIFIPSIVSMPARYPENKYNNLCPYVQSLPYQIKATFADVMSKTKLLTAPFHLGEGRRNLKAGFFAIAEQLQIPRSKAEKAIKAALEAQNNFENDCLTRGRQILAELSGNEEVFVLISRPYNGCDSALNMELAAKLASLGAEVIPMEMLDLTQISLTDAAFHEKIYWGYGQNILRAAEAIKRDNRLYAIYLSNFSCGPDSFLATFFKDLMGEKPCLELELDEHSADAGIVTRLEAFLESLKNYQPQADFSPVSESNTPKAPIECKNRTLYIPWMGECSLAMAAAFRAHGQPAEVLPLADQTALLYGRQFTTGKECLPCAITAGDMLKLTKSTAFDPDRTAFFMPSGTGPCRFGMYNCLHSLILKYAGLQNIPIIAPNQDTDFYRDLNTRTSNRLFGSFSKTAWLATVSVDLLSKLILKIRPLAADPNHADAVFKQSVAELASAVEKGAGLSKLRKLMNRIAAKFLAINLNYSLRKPLIGIVGEIYVRSHTFANQDIVRRLEKLGAACRLASLAEWIYYTNFFRRETALLMRDYPVWLENTLAQHYQHRTEKLLAEPLEKYFGPLAEEPIENIIRLAEKYIHRSFGGEAILSIGKAIEYHRHGVGGIVNVMPFTCMPSTIVSTITTRLSADCDNLPILNLSFDGTEDPSLATRLEAFVEQLQQKQSSCLTASQLVSTV